MKHKKTKYCYALCEFMSGMVMYQKNVQEVYDSYNKAIQRCVYFNENYAYNVKLRQGYQKNDGSFGAYVRVNSKKDARWFYIHMFTLR